MKTESCLFRCIVSTAVVLCRHVSLASGDDRFEYWAQIGAQTEVTKHWEFEAETELRFSADASQLYCHNVDFGFVYTGLADGVDLGFMYLREYETNGEGRWRPENRPHLDLSLRSTLFGFSLCNRSQFEYRDLDNEEDYWRYRNMTRVIFPMEFTKLKLRPFLAEEPFIDMRNGDFNKNRFYAGVYYKLTDKIDGRLSYLWEAHKSGGDWEDAHVFLMNIVFHIE